MRRDAIAIELGERGHGPGRLAEAPQVGRGEEQAQVARLAELVDLDQPQLQLGQSGARRGLQRVHSRRRLIELGLDPGGVGIDALELGGFDQALDLERAQVADQRALVRREAIGLALERLEALGGPPRERFRPRPLRRLRRQGDDEDERRGR